MMPISPGRGVRNPMRITGLCLFLLICSLLALGISTSCLAEDESAVEPGPVLRIKSGTLNINGDQYTRVLPINENFTSLHQILDKIQGNGLDEIILKDKDGKRYIAFGQYGALNTPGKMQIGYIGNLNNELKLEVEHVNDEINTPLEGFFSAYKDLGQFLPSTGEGSEAGKGPPVGGIATLLGVGYLGQQVIKQAGLIEGAAGRITGEALKQGFSKGAFNLLKGAPWIAAGLLIGWPALKAGWTWLRQTFDRNDYTVSMLTGRTAEEVNKPIHVTESQRREMNFVDIGDRVFGSGNGGLNAISAEGSSVLNTSGPDDVPNADDVLR